MTASLAVEHSKASFREELVARERGGRVVLRLDAAKIVDCLMSDGLELGTVKLRAMIEENSPELRPMAEDLAKASAVVVQRHYAGEEPLV